MGGIFVVDNCTVHMKGDNGELQDQLLRDLGLLMVPLPPYWCELNLTELVFQTLLVRLNTERRRYNATSSNNFYLDIDGEMGAFSQSDVKIFISNVDTKNNCIDIHVIILICVTLYINSIIVIECTDVKLKHLYNYVITLVHHLH